MLESEIGTETSKHQITFRKGIITLLQQMHEIDNRDCEEFQLKQSLERMVVKQAKMLGILVPDDSDPETNLIKANNAVHEGLAKIRDAADYQNYYYRSQLEKAQEIANDPIFQNNDKSLKSSI